MPIGQGVSRIGILKTRFQSDNPVNLLRLKAIAMSLFRSPSLPIQINNLRNLRDLREIVNYEADHLENLFSEWQTSEPPALQGHYSVHRNA